MKMIGVKFGDDCKHYFCDLDDFLTANIGANLPVNSRVVIDSDGFIEIGTIVSKVETKNIDELSPAIKKVLRIASIEDEKKAQMLDKKAKDSVFKIRKVADKYSSEMKVVSCVFSLDESKLFVNYTSENRVDFREIVKELAGMFRTRIEMRQIGDRDEARICGGLGPCGKVCCCKEFLNDFAPVSIKMAKNQNLSLNPNKISGICGRLYCCLSFENAHYAETQNLMPKINSTVTCPAGKGTVVYNDLLKRTVSVRINSEKEGLSQVNVYDLDKIEFSKGENTTNSGIKKC